MRFLLATGAVVVIVVTIPQLHISRLSASDVLGSSSEGASAALSSGEARAAMDFFTAPSLDTMPVLPDIPEPISPVALSRLPVLHTSLPPVLGAE